MRRDAIQFMVFQRKYSKVKKGKQKFPAANIQYKTIFSINLSENIILMLFFILLCIKKNIQHHNTMCKSNAYMHVYNQEITHCLL